MNIKMCWHSSKKISPKISKVDIPVFKICKRIPFDDKHVESKYKYFIYELDKLYTENVIPYISSEGIQIINKAFHSYDMCLRIITHMMKSFDDIVVEGIIPKGATYYLNEFGEIASNQIILKKIN